MYEVFEHTADLGLRIRAATREELFAESARALFSVLVGNLDAVELRTMRTLRVEGTEDDYLLFDWLNELLYIFETERLVLSDFQVTLDAGGLNAECRGEPLDRRRHRAEHEVKAITYHGLKVVQIDGDWVAEVVVDI